MRTLAVLVVLVAVAAGLVLPPRALSAVPQERNALFCDMCVKLITSLEEDVENDENNIIVKANAECDKLFHSGLLDSACKMMVDKEIDKVEDDIKNKEPPKKVCTKIDMCPQSQ